MAVEYLDLLPLKCSRLFFFINIKEYYTYFNVWHEIQVFKKKTKYGKMSLYFFYLLDFFLVFLGLHFV